MKRDAHLTKPIPGYDVVPVWKRFVAFCIDILVFDFVVGAPLVALLPRTFSLEPTPTIMAVGTVLFGFFFAYLVISQYLINQTIGMLFMRYKTTRTDRLWRCIVRNVFILPTFPFMILWIIDPVVLAFTGDRLTERLSGTSTEAL